MAIQPPYTVRADPPCEQDGSCAVCPKPRLRAGVKPLYAEAAASDPFCSTACARAWHGCSLPVTEHKGRPSRGSFVHGTEGGYVNHGCRCDACRAASAKARRERR